MSLRKVFINSWINQMIKYSFLFLVLFTVACQKEKDKSTIYHYQLPEQLDDGIRTSTLEAEDMDTSIICQMMDSINSGNYGQFYSLLIFRNDQLVFENYFEPWTLEDKLKLFSVTKSISSAVVGIANDQGLINLENTRIRQYLSDYESINWTEQKEKINLFHILTMTAGFEWDELSVPFEDTANSHYKMLQSDDWNRYLLNTAMLNDPGYYFNYNTASVNLLAPMMQTITGNSFEMFMDDFLLDPLGIEDYLWIRSPQGEVLCGGSLGGIMMRPRDLAKFALLYANDGKWEEEQIISSSWIEQSLNTIIPLDEDHYYGYLWWIKPVSVNGVSYNCTQAVGYAGQYILLIEDLELIVIINSFNPGAELLPYSILEDFIIPSLM